jgi:hypothetical protein
MDDLDLQLDAFAARLHAKLRRDLLSLALVPLAVGLLAGGLVGRAWRPSPAAMAPACAELCRAHGAFRLDVGDHGVRMNLEGNGD